MMTDADSEGYVQDDTSAAIDDSITDGEETLVKQDEQNDDNAETAEMALQRTSLTRTLARRG